jgi:dolichol-phosphate mannosyltransferase
VVLPVYSETDSVVEIVGWLQSHIAEELAEIIIIMAPQSHERTKQICAELARREHVRLVIQDQGLGLGIAYRQGFREARGNHILMLDSDGEMDLQSIPLMIKSFVGGQCDVVVGSRWISGGGVSGYDPVKYFFNRLFQHVFRVLYRTSLHDLTLGFKMLNQSVVDCIAWQGVRHEIATETTLKPLHYGYRVCEVPARWKSRTQGKSKNNWRMNFRYLRIALVILLNPRKPNKV